MFFILGWLENILDLEKYYFISIFFIGFDIIFFWVVRMIMMGVYLIGKMLFEIVYIYGLMLDENGKK